MCITASIKKHKLLPCTNYESPCTYVFLEETKSIRTFSLQMLSPNVFYVRSRDLACQRPIAVSGIVQYVRVRPVTGASASRVRLPLILCCSQIAQTLQGRSGLPVYGKSEVFIG